MEQDFYTGPLGAKLAEAGGAVHIPEAPRRKIVHDVIYDELCRGAISEASRTAYQQIMAAEAEEKGQSNAYCPLLPAIANGAVEYSNDRVAPCTATFKCNEGYSLGGAGVTETVIDCVPAGRSALWSGAPPTCIPAAGSAPEDVDVPR